MIEKRDFHPQVRGSIDLSRQARMDRYRLESHERLCELLLERDKQIEGLKRTSDNLIKAVLISVLVVFLLTAYSLNIFHIRSAFPSTNPSGMVPPSKDYNREVQSY